MNHLKSGMLALSLAFSPCMFATVRAPLELFEKWITIQREVGDKPLSQFSDLINDSYLAEFKKNYENNLFLLQSLNPYLRSITAGSIDQDGYQFSTPIPHEFKESIGNLFTSLETNPTNFIDNLKHNGFTCKELLQADASPQYNDIVEKYKALFKLLLSQKSTLQEEAYLLAVGNRLVEYCYAPATFPHYRDLLLNKDDHSIVRMLHATIWYSLIGNGWKHWHKDCLQALKIQTDAGKRVTYVAGGNDVYSLLANGIYNVTIVDPFLPSQVRYYANNWEWFLAGDIGDEIAGMFGNNELRLRRTNLVEGEQFYAKAGGQFVPLKKLTTTWTVFDLDENEQGTIVIERRFAVQSDFADDPNKVILMSYDEAIYAALPSILDGWGITTKSMSAQAIYIKQLRRPITKHHLSHLRVASLINYADIKFINLASDPN